MSSSFAHLLGQAENVVSNGDVDHPTPDGEDDPSDLASEVASEDEISLVEDIQFYTKCLMHLAPTLQVILDRQVKTSASQFISPPNAFCVSGPAQFYVTLARDKFPHAEQTLVDRLGERCWQRHEKIRDRIQNPVEDSDRGSPVVEVLSTAQSIFTSPSVFHDSGLGTSVITPSQHAGSAASHTSFASSIDNGAKSLRRVPPTPAEVGSGIPFRCFVCRKMQYRIKNRVDWR